MVYRYLYSAVMPSPNLSGGVMPIFYFLNGTHTESAFQVSLNKFYQDVKKLQLSEPTYKNCEIQPKQCITDMSLVIFRPALGKNSIH